MHMQVLNAALACWSRVTRTGHQQLLDAGLCTQ